MLSFCTSGYQELTRDGETPMVGSEYLLEALDDFKYDMSFTVHISQGATPFLFLFNPCFVVSCNILHKKFWDF